MDFIISHIKQNELAEAITQFSALLDQALEMHPSHTQPLSKLKNQLILTSRRHSEIQELALKQLTPKQEIDLEKNNIASALLKMVDQWKTLSAEFDQSEEKESPSTSVNRLTHFRSRLPLYIEMSVQGGSYQARIHQGNRDVCCEFSDIQLSPSATPVKGHTQDLGTLVGQAQEGAWAELGERLQVELGQYLFQQTLDQLPKKFLDPLLESPHLDIRILTEDPWIRQLPWHLLTVRGIFKAASGWTVSLSQHLANTEVELPSRPRLLIVVPEPHARSTNDADNHVEELVEALSAMNEQFVLGKQIEVVKSWDALTRAVKDFEPDVVYFYGHIEVKGGRTQLLFSEASSPKPDARSVAEVVAIFQVSSHTPVLMYFNGCHTHGAQFLDETSSVIQTFPAVMTNRVVAPLDVLQKQARVLLSAILFEGKTPHQAVSQLYISGEFTGLSSIGMRWSTPILHANYGNWTATPSRSPDRLTQDPHWHLKVDRVSQFSLVMTQSRQMLREQKPRTLFFSWYGQEGQGIEIFHRRLWVELREDLMNNVFIYQVKPAWPMHLENYHRAFSEMIRQAFKVSTLEDIPARIRKESQGTYGKQTLVYLRHEPVRSPRLINPAALKEYIRWWDKEMTKLLDRKQFALVSVSFLVKNPPAFVEYMEAQHIDELETSKTVFWLLDELEHVARRDFAVILKNPQYRTP